MTKITKAILVDQAILIVTDQQHVWRVTFDDNTDRPVSVQCVPPTPRANVSRPPQRQRRPRGWLIG